jgi:cytochrome c
MTRRSIILALIGALGVPALAQAQEAPNLKKAPDSRTVAKAEFCHGAYQLRMRDGSEQRVMELNLRLKTDTGPRGPNPNAPVLLPAGMRGDRFSLVFSSPEEISAFVKRSC